MKSLGITGRTFAGLILAIVGTLLLLTALGVGGEAGLWRWFPSLFIVLGLWALIKNRFRRPTAPLIAIVIATVVQFFLVFEGFDSGIVWAIVLIAIGIFFIVGGARTRKKSREPSTVFTENESSSLTDPTINSVNVWASNQRIVESDEFQGGEVTAVMGSIELDMRNAQISQSPARLEVAAVMGEVKLRVPSNWKVNIDTSNVMGATQDNRPPNNAVGRQDELVVTGSAVMGNIEITA